ncbi:MAG TPA: hypothetical protein DCS15_10925 [Flavobacteriales bacterium]|nr:hypothetical protein [Flavobacteriales bacterium]
MDQAHFAVLSAVFFVSFSLESKLSLKDTSFRFISLVSANILFVLMRKNFRGTGFPSLRSVYLSIHEMDQAYFAVLLCS